MKRIRGEQMQMSVVHYLKRRKFSDGGESGYHKKERQNQNLSEMALNQASISEGAMGNTISYSSISGDATACDQQYTRIKTFIHEAVEPYREQLLPLLYPLFVHVYLELVCNGQKTPAQKFFNRHSRLFDRDSSRKEMLSDLEAMRSKQDVSNSKIVSEFRENKYNISLCQEALNYIVRYLKGEDNVLMLQMFNNYIDMTVEGTEVHVDIHSQSERFQDSMELASHPCTPENKVITNEVTLSSLQQCIRTIREGPPCPPSICFYSFINSFQGLCSSSISPDNTKLVGGYEDSTLRIWNLKPGKLVAESNKCNVSHVHLACDTNEDVNNKIQSLHTDSTDCMVLRGHAGAVYGTCHSYDSQFIYSCGHDNTVRLWDTETFTNRVCYRGHTYPVWAVASSPVSSQFASSSHDKTAKLWTTDRLYPLRTFVGHLADVDCVSFHPNGSYIATGSCDKTVRLWSVQNGKTVRLFQGHRSPVLSLAFSPDGKLLASAGEDKRIKVWDLGNGSLLKDLRGHTESVYAMCFNTDSTLLASGGHDHCIKVWDVRKDVTNNNTIESHTSSELLGSYITKGASVHHLQYTQKNYIIGAGPITI